MIRFTVQDRTPLYDQYEAIIHKLGLSLMATHVPYRSKCNKELLPDGSGICRSTLLAPERTFAREAQIEVLAAEVSNDRYPSRRVTALC